jgi:hypothetical protein
METAKFRFVVALAVMFCAAASTVVFGGDAKVFSHKKLAIQSPARGPSGI